VVVVTGGREDVARALAELLREWRQTCERTGIPYTDEDAAAFAAEAYPLNLLSGERLAVARVEALCGEWERNERDHDPWYWSDAAEEVRAALSGDAAPRTTHPKEKP
jgi:hypothetical protein